MKAGTPFYT